MKSLSNTKKPDTVMDEEINAKRNTSQNDKQFKTKMNKNCRE